MIAPVKSAGIRRGPRRAREGIRDAAVGSSRGRNMGADIVYMVKAVDDGDTAILIVSSQSEKVE
jgi:hypothetical protein